MHASQGSKQLSNRHSWFPSCWQSVARLKSYELLKHEPPAEAQRLPSCGSFMLKKKKNMSSKWNWPPDSRYPVLPRERSTCCNMQCQLSAICSTCAAIDGGFNTWIPIFRQIFKDQRVFQNVWGILASSKWAGISKELHLGSWFLFHNRMPRWDLVHLASAHLNHRFRAKCDTKMYKGTSLWQNLDLSPSCNSCLIAHSI